MKARAAELYIPIVFSPTTIPESCLLKPKASNNVLSFSRVFFGFFHVSQTSELLKIRPRLTMSLILDQIFEPTFLFLLMQVYVRSFAFLLNQTHTLFLNEK